MKNIAISIKPLESGHKARGIGYYTENLIEGLEKRKDINVITFRNEKELKDVDLIHYTWFDLFYKTLPLKSRFPRVVTVHDVMPLVYKDHYPSGMKGRLNFFLQKLALRNSKLIITDSESSKNDIEQYLKIKKEKIKVIYLAQDSSFKIMTASASLRAKLSYRLPDRFLLYVGDANYVKNLPLLIRAFISLKSKKEYVDLKLVLVGQVFLKRVENIDHPELVSLKEVLGLIKDNNLENEIILPGYVSTDDLIAFFNLATVYVQPSLYEGFGLPVLQAFACGTPVVSSRGGSLPEVGGKAAIYFSPTKLDELVSILNDVLSNVSLQRKLSRMGLQQASQFSWEKTIAETVKAYEEATLK